MNVIQKICNKVAVMDFGKVVETGSVIQVFSDPQSDIAKRFVGNLIHVIQGIVVGIMLVLFIGSDEEIKKAERYILESNEEYKEVVLP